jgi:uncharacterized SAM-binding protein YcdF (DUF218 family)
MSILKSQKVDIVIVLANLMDAYGTLNGESAGRAECAAGVFFKFNAKMIVTCGWAYRQDSPISIADAFKKHLIVNHCLSDSNILTEPNSRDTVGDAYFTKVNVIEPLGFTEILVVTSDYHIPRTKEIFDFVYGNHYSLSYFGAATRNHQERLESELSSLEAFKKTFLNVRRGDSLGVLGALRTNHPYYNGEVYPKI